MLPWPEAFYASVDEKYGSVDAFLTKSGVHQDARSALVASLTTEQLKLAMSNLSFITVFSFFQVNQASPSRLHAVVVASDIPFQPGFP